jgi:serine/threonine protein kinase
MVAPDALTIFFNHLRSCGLLSPQQLQDLGTWIVSQRPDVRAVAAELQRRGWLTHFQVQEIAQGRGRQLRLGAYLLLDLLGEGGMGRVYKAQHLRLGRLCAIKVIRRERLKHPAIEQRFRKEIEALGRMQHPNVVQVFNADQTGDVLYYEMEWIDGTDLTRLVKQRGPLPISQACDYVRQAALGLQHAYELGLVHRDIKPSNILVSWDGRQVKLVDLGLARILHDDTVSKDAAKRITKEGLVLGTPDFLAPEQARNPLIVDIRADIYSLGGTLYYLLTGRVPYEGSNPTEKMLKHCTDPPPPVLAYRPDVPAQLEQLIHWCMAKQPEQRPQTPIQLAVALQPFAVGTAGAALALPAGTVVATGSGSGTPQEPRSSQLFRLSPEAVAVIYRRRASWPWGLLAFLILAAFCFLVVALGLNRLWTSTSDSQARDTFTNTLGMLMVRLPAGEFLMGSPDQEKGRRPDEGPCHPVRLSREFHMSVTEVTNGQFQLLMGYTPSQSSKAASRSLLLPVDNVTWWEAVEFCRRLTEKEQKEPWARPGWGYRLPTEAEWEYAARAGTHGPFAFGQVLELGRTAVFKPDENDLYGIGGDPQRPPALAEEVGHRRQNALGLQDMHGNIAEWCADWYAPTYPAEGTARIDPIGPPDGERRVVRGGSFALPASACRSAARSALRPETRRPDVGFRVVYAPLARK